MNSKLVWIAIVLAIGAFVANSHIEQKAKREAQKAEAARIQREVQAAVSQISVRHNAVTDWAEQLSKGERYRMAPVLTIELEKLWQSERPVLFVGSVKDISSAGVDTYYVLVEQSLYNMDHMFSTELRLSLTTPKAMIDSFLQKHPKLLADGGFNNGVAVIATIHAISTSDERGEDGERIEVKTGQGRLLDLIYTGDVFF